MGQHCGQLSSRVLDSMDRDGFIDWLYESGSKMDSEIGS
jgi:hypothetical protein